jgi:hypothetical protein
VYVDENGGIHFESYINNLSAAAHPELCALVSAVLRRAVPMFERTLGSLRPSNRAGGPDPFSLGPRTLVSVLLRPIWSMLRRISIVGRQACTLRRSMGSSPRDP